MPFPVDEKYIELTEKKLGLLFPKSYKEKMKKDNGGEVATPPDAWVLYPFYDTSERKRIKRTAYDIVKETESARKWEGFPINAIAIGANGCGDLLILLKEKNDQSLLSNIVYWWDHETGSICEVASDFSNLAVL